MVTLDGSPDASTLSENGTASAASGCASASDDVNASASADCSSTAARGGARLRCVCSPSMSASAPFCLQRPHLPGLTAVWMNDRSDLSMVMDCESCAHHSGGMESVNHAQECGLPARSSVGIVVLLINSKMRIVCPAQTGARQRGSNAQARLRVSRSPRLYIDPKTCCHPGSPGQTRKRVCRL